MHPVESPVTRSAKRRGIVRNAAQRTAAFCYEMRYHAASALGFLNRWPGVRVTPGASPQNRSSSPDKHPRQSVSCPVAPLLEGEPGVWT